MIGRVNQMKVDEEAVAEAARIEYDEKSGKLYLVFEVKNPKYKRHIMETWTKDIEYVIVNHSLHKKE